MYVKVAIVPCDVDVEKQELNAKRAVPVEDVALIINL